MIPSLLRRALRIFPHTVVRRDGYQCMHRRCHRQGTRGALDYAISRGLHAASIIDVGTELGTAALWSRFPKAAQLLVEPRKECLPTLERHAREAKACGVEVRIACVAAGDVEGTAEFQVAAKGESSSLLGPADSTPPTEKVRVPIRTIDNLLSEQPLPTPIFLKIDAEGYDLKVLQGAVETLPKCCMVMIEGTPKARQEGACRMSELVHFMETRNWALSDIISLHYDEGNMLDHFDMLFLPNDKLLNTSNSPTTH